jgi:Domain of unknown function (DUF6473)
VGLFYQRMDGKFLDYGMVQLHGEWFRGPLDQGPDSIAWLGAAQTFGRYVTEPVPAIVGRRLGLGTLNLGSGGKGPDYFLLRPELLEEVNRCRVAVVQIMSARGSDNSIFKSERGGASGVRLDTGTKEPKALTVVTDLIAQGKVREARRLVRESQQAYVESMLRLLKSVKTPKVLFWFSYRNPPLALTGFRRTLEIFPHLVHRGMVNELRPSADGYAAVSSRAGIPQVLLDEEGNRVAVNHYYPSPEMHRLAADRLTGPVRELLR